MPLRWLFVDMNSYFASVEQQDRPHLRGRPVVVAPVDTDSTCAIAASYEAKAFGIRTGTNIGEARARCPELQIVLANPRRYTEVHRKIKEAVESCLHVDVVGSIDEMAGRLMGIERETAHAVAIGRRVKQRICESVGEYLKCSIGIAPNRVLAKVAADMQKPDGLTVLEEADLPQSLYKLQLMDLPGIGPRMHRRLLSHGIGTVEQLCTRSEKELRSAWNSVLGSIWWQTLRGFDMREKPTPRRTVGHSHVLAPHLRTDAGAREVLVRMIHKAAARLRSYNCWAQRMHVKISYTFSTRRWSHDLPLGNCQDTPTMVHAFGELWSKHPRPPGTPLKVAMRLENLTETQFATIPLFPEERHRVELSRAMDHVNHECGSNTVYLAAMHNARHAAPTRIAFNQVPDFEPEFS